ncbi:hypothetical protein NO2_1433 [Candidatus Termititenax persephonae]|uniref:Uncharacterized protein n=1 Tax=Candidatus Termititenax persephonae TaxID=2218525 RepID=A0A388TJ15_9BACT|nr:hypothetical protein NO2_1433 [Candidatus Termititenax persephonae]
MRKMFIKILCLFVLCGVALYADEVYGGGYKGQAQVIPHSDNTIQFQGYVTDSKNRPYFGIATIDFAFYDREIGGTPIITKGAISRPVSIYNGNYATKLSLPDEVLSKLNKESNIWVEVYFSKGNSSKTDALEPRVQLNSAPYAFALRGFYYDITKDMLGFGNYTPASGSGGFVVSGNVGIGTHNPTGAKLHVAGSARFTGNIGVTGTVNLPGKDTVKVYGGAWN